MRNELSELRRLSNAASGFLVVAVTMFSCADRPAAVSPQTQAARDASEPLPAPASAEPTAIRPHPPDQSVDAAAHAASTDDTPASTALPVGQAPRELAFMTGPLPRDLVIDFALDCPRCMRDPFHVVLDGESRLIAKRAQSSLCDVRCGQVDAKELDALWRLAPLEELGSMLLPANTQVNQALMAPENALVVMSVHANKRSYVFVSRNDESAQRTAVWLGKLKNLALEERKCPEVNVGNCYAPPPNAPVEMHTTSVAVEDYLMNSDALRIAEALAAPFWSCLERHIQREPFRRTKVDFSARLAVTREGAVALLEFSDSHGEIECLRRMATSAKADALTHSLDMRAHYFAGETCDRRPCNRMRYFED